MQIRTATKLDTHGIRETNLLAFPDSENRINSTLAVNLLGLKTTPPTLSLVAEDESEVIGHLAFSPVSIRTTRNGLTYILGPLSVKPQYQHRKIGSSLIQHGLQLLSQMNVSLVFVYGDPKYYGRFGFNAESAALYRPPYKLQYPFGWLALALHQGSEIKAPTDIVCVEPLMNPDLW